MVISCRWSASLRCFYDVGGGNRPDFRARSVSKRFWIKPSPLGGSRQWKVALPGAKRGPSLLLLLPALNGLFMCLSQQPQSGAEGAFIKILLCNDPFFACEQEAAEESALLWPSFSVPWSFIMESTVVFIFSQKKGKDSYFHFSFLDPSELKWSTMTPLCQSKRSGMELQPHPDPHLSIVFLSPGRLTHCSLCAVTTGNANNK